MSDNTQIRRERAVELADQDLALIAQLLESKPYTDYFVRRLKERRQILRDCLADDDTLDDAETRRMRAIVKEYDSILAMPVQDRTAHTSTLENAKRAASGPSRG